MIEENPELLGEIVTVMPGRFADLITNAIAARTTGTNRESAVAIAQTMISAAIGIKHQVSDRGMYVKRLAVAIDLLLR